MSNEELPKNWSNMNYIQKLNSFVNTIGNYIPEVKHHTGMGPLGTYPIEQYKLPEDEIEPYMKREELKPFFQQAQKDGNMNLLLDLNFIGNTWQNRSAWPWRPTYELHKKFDNDEIENEYLLESMKKFKKERDLFLHHNEILLRQIREFAASHNLPLKLYKDIVDETLPAFLSVLNKLGKSGKIKELSEISFEKVEEVFETV